MTFQYGTVKRTKPRIRVYSGYDPQSPQSAHLPNRLPVAANEVIFSGMIISSVWNGATSAYEWRAGIPAGADETVVASLSVADGDSLDEDIIAAGVLPGLTCSGLFDLHSGYFAGNIGAVDGGAAGTDQTYNGGILLTPCTDADIGKDGQGNFKVAGELAGWLKVTTPESGDPVVGVCHPTMRGPINLGGVSSGNNGGGVPLGFTPGQDSSATDLLVVRFRTKLAINSTDAIA